MRSVLVVDDEPSGFDVIEGILLDESYTLHYAQSGTEALKRLAIPPQPDVILLDVMMPNMDGLEVCRRVKSNPEWKNIPVIMVTALRSRLMLAQCFEAGADDFVDKPASAIELRARVRSMLRIKEQHDALQTALQLRQDMVHMLVHDLRNPLASVIMACEVLKRIELPEKPQQKIEQIEIATHQLQALIDSLLMMAKLEAGDSILNRTLVDFYSLGQQVMADFEPIAAQKRIRLSAQLPPAGQGLAVDTLMIRRVLDNLMSNAIKFSPTGSQVRLIIHYPTDTTVCIQVTDEGPGVEESQRQKIFEKFEVGVVMSEVPQIGLGLAFCKLAIAAHGGRIRVEDNTPRGCIFTVELSNQPPAIGRSEEPIN